MSRAFIATEQEIEEARRNGTLIRVPGKGFSTFAAFYRGNQEHYRELFAKRGAKVILERELPETAFPNGMYPQTLYVYQHKHELEFEELC